MKTLTLKSLWLFIAVFAATAFSNFANAQTIQPDKLDYAPLSSAVFTGTDFWPNESVTIKVKNLTQPCATTMSDSSYTPWTTVADVNGNPPYFKN